jgi:hypothetical protein
MAQAPKNLFTDGDCDDRADDGCIQWEARRERHSQEQSGDQGGSIPKSLEGFFSYPEEYPFCDQAGHKTREIEPDGSESEKVYRSEKSGKECDDHGVHDFGDRIFVSDMGRRLDDQRVI